MSIFTKVKMPKVGSSSFNLNHDKKLSFDMGELVPTCVLDVVPGDKFKINVESMFRFAPLISPVMHKYKVRQEFFFVPNRILWSNWEKWITGELETDPPYVNTLNQAKPGTLGDYLGYPEGGAATSASLNANALPIAAYFKIYDEYYRDENLIAEKFAPLVDGFNNNYKNNMIGQPLKRAWMHDYLTSCLPFAQKGDAVTIPAFGANPPVIPVYDNSTSANVADVTGSPMPDSDLKAVNGRFSGSTFGVLDPNGTLVIDSQQTAQTIETLRKAFRLQEWLEKNARGGTRYTEHIKAHFGVFSSDQRLQRPEYIGGASGNVVISEVLSTAESTVTPPGGSQTYNPVGNMSGHGIAVNRGSTFTYRAEEHGFLIGITCISPVTAYHQGLPKMMNRPSYLDYYYPSFANLGEQEVLNSELYIGEETLESLQGAFGYVPKYSEYKYMNSSVHGDFKETLEFWQHGRKFANKPELNETFIECNPDKRIFAVTSENVDSIYGHIFNNIRAIRKMPKYGLPTI